MPNPNSNPNPDLIPYIQAIWPVPIKQEPPLNPEIPENRSVGDKSDKKEEEKSPHHQIHFWKHPGAGEKEENRPKIPFLEEVLPDWANLEPADRVIRWVRAGSGSRSLFGEKGPGQTKFKDGLLSKYLSKSYLNAMFMVSSCPELLERL